MQITIREPGSAITHFIAMMMAVFAAVPLLVKAGVQSGQENFLAMAIFMGSMILLYGASATYHSVDLTGKSLRVFRKLDHMMILARGRNAPRPRNGRGSRPKPPHCAYCRDSS